MRMTPRVWAVMLLVSAIIALVQAVWAAGLAIMSGEPLIWLLFGMAAAFSIWLFHQWGTARQSQRRP